MIELNTLRREIKKLFSVALAVALIPGDDFKAYNIGSYMRGSRLILSLKSSLISIDVDMRRWGILSLHHAVCA